MATIVDTYHDRDTDLDSARERAPSDVPRGVVTDSAVAVVAAKTAMIEYRGDHNAFDPNEPDDLDDSGAAERPTQTEPSTDTRRALAAPALVAATGHDRSATTPERSSRTNVEQGSDAPALDTGSSGNGKGIDNTRGGATSSPDGGDGGEGGNDPWKLPENFGRDPIASKAYEVWTGIGSATRVKVVDVGITRKTPVDPVLGYGQPGRHVNVTTELFHPDTGVRIAREQSRIDLPIASGDSEAEELAGAIPEALAHHVGERAIAKLTEFVRPGRSRDVGDASSSQADTPQEIRLDPENTVRVPSVHAKELAVAAGPAEERDRDRRMVVDRALLNSALIAAGADGPSVSMTVDQYVELHRTAAGGYLPLLARAGDAPETLTPDERGMLDQTFSYLRTPEVASVVKAIYGVDPPQRKVVELARERGHARPLVSQALARGLYDFQYVAPQIVTGTFDPQAWQRIHKTIKSPFGLAIALGESIPANTTTETARGLALEALKNSRVFPGDEAAIVADLWGLTGNPPMGRTGAAGKVQERAGRDTDTGRHKLVVADVAVRLMKLLTGEGDGTR